MEKNEILQNLNSGIKLIESAFYHIKFLQKIYWNEYDTNLHSNMAANYLKTALTKLKPLCASIENNQIEQMSKLNNGIELLESAFNHVKNMQKVYWNEDDTKLNSGMAANYLEASLAKLKPLRTSLENDQTNEMCK